MIYGFPGNTQEYILSDAVAYIAERSDPAKIAIRTGRLDIISKAQESDPALRIFYAARHASIANAWKKWQGEVLGIERRGTVASKRAYEEAFDAWAQDKPRYRNVVAQLKAEYARIADPYFAREITLETLGALPIKYSAKERAEAVFARRKATERALYSLQFGEYAHRCPAQFQIPEFLDGVAGTARRGLCRRNFHAGMERERHHGGNRPALGNEAHARPHHVAHGHQIAAQPQQQAAQRALHHLYQRAARMGCRTGFLP